MSVVKSTADGVLPCFLLQNRFTIHDVVLCDTKINYSMGELNPLDSVIFFGQQDGTGTIKQDRASNILPKHFEVSYFMQWDWDCPVLFT
jgi:hypothetical protein